MAPRHLVALGLLAVVAAPSCVSTLGLNEEYRSAVEQLCACPSISPPFATTRACVAELEFRLERASASGRSAWMKNFTEKCDTCPADPIQECVRVTPTCEGTGECPSAGCQLCCQELPEKKCF